MQILHVVSVVQVFILFFNHSSDFSFLKLSGTKSHIFGASEERLSLPKYIEFVFILYLLASEVIVSYIKRKQFF